MLKKRHFDFLKLGSKDKPSTSLRKLCFIKHYLGISFLAKIITPQTLRFLSGLHGKQKQSI